MSGPLNGLAWLKSYTGLTLVAKTARRAVKTMAAIVLSSATHIFLNIEVWICSFVRRAFPWITEIVIINYTNLVKMLKKEKTSLLNITSMWKHG